MATHKYIHNLTVEMAQRAADSSPKDANVFSNYDMQYLLDVIKEKDAELLASGERIAELNSQFADVTHDARHWKEEAMAWRNLDMKVVRYDPL